MVGLLGLAACSKHEAPQMSAQATGPAQMAALEPGGGAAAPANAPAAANGAKLAQASLPAPPKSGEEPDRDER